MVSIERCRCLLADPRQRREYARMHRRRQMSAVWVTEPVRGVLGKRKPPLALPHLTAG